MKAVVFVTEVVPESLMPGKLPLVLLPMIDRPLIELQVEALVEQGVTEIQLYAVAGLERLRSLLGNGARWGCTLTIHPLRSDRPLTAFHTLPETQEPVLVALAEVVPFPEICWPTATIWTTPWDEWAGVCVASAELLRRIPEEVTLAQLPEVLRPQLTLDFMDRHPMRSLGEFIVTQQAELARRIQNEVHVARSARVHPRARLVGPAWIGPQCRVGAGVQLGPNVCLGAGCIVERGTRLQDALIAPGSYIGADLELDRVYVDRSRLINLRQEIGLTIDDAFLLGSAAKL